MPIHMIPLGTAESAALIVSQVTCWVHYRVLWSGCLMQQTRKQHSRETLKSLGVSAVSPAAATQQTSQVAMTQG
jgi:hypothetical protein